MPDQLMSGQPGTGGGPAAARPRSGPGDRGGLGAALQVLGVLAVLAAGGALCGVVWHWWWEPAVGVVADGTWFTDEQGLRGDFSGTATYVVVAAVGGLLLGALCAHVFDRSELLTLAAVAVGSALAGWLMWRVGVHLGPPDPERLARTAEEGARLPDDLAVTGRSPFLAFPTGALLGLALVDLLLLGKRER